MSEQEALTEVDAMSPTDPRRVMEIASQCGSICLGQYAAARFYKSALTRRSLGRSRRKVVGERVLRSAYRIVNNMPRDKIIPAKLKFGSVAAALAILFTSPAQTRSEIIKAETYACTS